MINKNQLINDIIKPSLECVGLYSEDAVHLLKAICVHESNAGTYVKQINGPALGIFQIEPATYKDLVFYLKSSRPDLRNMILDIYKIGLLPHADSGQLVWDLRFSVIMARVFFLRIPEPLPGKNIAKIATYWKKYYNTPKGRGTEDAFIASNILYDKR